MKAMLTAVYVAALAALALPASAQPAGDPYALLVEEVRNDHPAFMVRVDVDHFDRVYRGGEVMQVRVVSERAGFLYLIYCDASGGITCLFPNALEQDNSIPAGRPVLVPPPGAPFRVRITPPYGLEVLKGIVTTVPVSPEQLAELLEGRSSSRGLNAIHAGVKSLPYAWAEHHVVTTTVAPAAPPSIGAPRRVGVFIGVSEYQDPSIPTLRTAHKDAASLADALSRYCRLDRAEVLVNAQATRAAIEQALRQRLSAETRPGDTVMIFWSGHGGRCADTHGDETSGYDEYLVPYDGQWGDPPAIQRTMLLDDTFGRWMQELDGRRIVVILDTCYSSGQGATKSLSKGLELPSAGPTPRFVRFNFLDRTMRRAKDLGQKELAMLASSQADQISFERRENDLGVMNYYLIERLSAPDGPLTLAEVHAYLARRVPEYVERQFPGATQTPVLIDQLTPPFYLRP